MFTAEEINALEEKYNIHIDYDFRKYLMNPSYYITPEDRRENTLFNLFAFRDQCNNSKDFDLDRCVGIWKTYHIYLRICRNKDVEDDYIYVDLRTGYVWKGQDFFITFTDFLKYLKFKY